MVLRQIHAAGDTLEVATRDQVPLQWAETQTSLGVALATLGERESGTARLEAAVMAFHAALDVNASLILP